MSKEKINETLPKEQRLGQVGINNQGLKMTIINYRGCMDLDVQFEDGIIVENRRYEHFLHGKISHPNNARCYDSNIRINEININNQGLAMKIIAYKNATNISVQFEDGTIVENRSYVHFKNGKIAYPYSYEDRIGEEKENNQGLTMKIIAYRNAKDLDVQFKDGTIVENRSYDAFKKGTIAHPTEHSDGISIPEKFVMNIFKELGIKFITQLNKSTFEWCKNYRYDFYIPSLNMIVETHGNQHYKGGFENFGGRTLEQEQENDKLKKELALNNNIEKYIIIDCRYSLFDWLKKNVIKELGDYFDLSNINWGLIWNNSLKNLVWEVKRLTEEGNNITKIAEILNIDRHTVANYKKQLNL